LNDKVRARRMKLAIVLPSLRHGLRYWPPIIQALDAEGITVRVFTSMPPPEAPSIDLEVVKGRILRDRINIRGHEKPFSYQSPQLVSRLIRWRPDVIIATEYRLATLWSLIAGRLRRCPVAIFQEHGSPERYLRSPTRRLFRLLVLARLADAFIANTDEAAAEFITRLRVPPRKVFEVPLLLPPPRDYLLTDPIELPPVAFRPVFLFVGRLIRLKNVRSLLEAAHRLDNEGRKFAVWIAGNGPERESLERLVELTGLRNIVTFLGAVPYRSIGHVYEASDVLVMPTFTDVVSIAVLEAIRFEKPVIGSKLGGFAGYVVLDRVNGFIFDPTNVAELAGYMRAFIDDPMLVSSMGNRSAERFAGLSHERSARQLAQVLRSRLLGWDDENAPSKEVS
jgi:glycosyltransferase involved in cell wall biosynthesis